MKSFLSLRYEFGICMERKVYLIVTAGGSGTRMGAGIPKQFLLLGGKAILRMTIEKFVEAMEQGLGRPVATGVFGADMQVGLINDGPVTICIDTKNKE